MHNLFAYAVAIIAILLIGSSVMPQNGISLQSIATIELPINGGH